MKIATPLSEKLGLRLPVIQAPMAGGPSSQELVAACSAAGVLGSFGFAYTQPDDMRKQAAFVRSKTDRPFGINLFVAPLPEAIAPDAQRAALDAVAGYYREFGLGAPEPVKTPYAPDQAAQIAAVAEIKPRVFTVHFGVTEIRPLKEKGILVGGNATCIEEAKRLETLGFDFVIAQGNEAGGHFGTSLRDPAHGLTGTLALTRAIVRSVKIPVVSAGGIMDGAGIAAVLALGAQAAQMGTAFVPCPESGAPQPHKDALTNARDDITRITTKFSGKPARGVVNRYMAEMENKPVLTFPVQNAVSGKLRQASAKAGKPDFIAMWAGQGVALSRALPAMELIGLLEKETIQALRQGAALLKE
jgi:nitronate monooxygenase